MSEQLCVGDGQWQHQLLVERRVRQEARKTAEISLQTAIQMMLRIEWMLVRHDDPVMALEAARIRTLLRKIKKRDEQKS